MSDIYTNQALASSVEFEDPREPALSSLAQVEQLKRIADALEALNYRADDLMFLLKNK